MGEINKNSELTILGKVIKPGESKTIDFNIARLYTTTNVEIPIIIKRSTKPGPVVLLTGGIHGDEINGVEIVRNLIARKITNPKIGTIICIPILNIFGFLNGTREFPDGRDLNRCFPGIKSGSLASQVAYRFTKEVLPHVDYCLDFHAGGAQRFNAAQIRIKPGNKRLLSLAKAFNPPFIVYSKNIKKTYRSTSDKLGIPLLLFEGGKTNEGNKHIVMEGVRGVERFLDHLGMLNDSFTAMPAEGDSIVIGSTRWMRAAKSGLFHLKIKHGKYVEKGEFMATITDPFGTMRYKVLAPNDGYVINTNQSPIVYKGDAIFHISKDKSI